MPATLHALSPEALRSQDRLARVVSHCVHQGRRPFISRVSRLPSNVLACFHFPHPRASPGQQPEAAGVLISLEARHPHSYCGVRMPLTLLIETLPICNMVTATGIMRLLEIFQFISAVNVQREDALAAGAAADHGGAHL
jgi:hypothetical protein